MMKRKKIAVVATSAAIGNEKGLNRMFYLAELLGKNEYDVEFITSDFQHWTKKHRNYEDVRKYEEYCRITLLHEIGYKKNVDPKRIVSHFLFAQNVRKYLNKNNYDLIYSDLPDNHVSMICAKQAKKKNIPYIADIEDLWPKAMKMVFSVPIISNILFSYFIRDAKQTYKLATGVIGSSDTYRDNPKDYGITIECKETVYVGNDLTLFDNGVQEYKGKIEKNNGEFWVTYAGTLGASYDIITLIKAADILKKQGFNNIKIMLLGDGPERANFEKEAKKLSGNVNFIGYLPFTKMAGYLASSDVVINSVKKNAPQSIVSKIGDYLASGRPMINTCVDPEFWKKVEDDGFGINVIPENAELLSEAIVILQRNELMREEMGKRARSIAETQFDRKTSFMKIVNMITKLIHE